MIGLVILLFLVGKLFPAMKHPDSCFASIYASTFYNEKSVHLDDCPIKVARYSVKDIVSTRLSKDDLDFEKKYLFPSNYKYLSKRQKKEKKEEVDFITKFDKILADHLYSCWKRTGQGDLLLANKIDHVDPQSSICIVCSRLVFNSDVSHEFESIFPKKSIVYLNDLHFIKYLMSRKTLQGSYFDQIKKNNVFLSSLFFQGNFLKIPVWDRAKKEGFEVGFLNVEFLSTADVKPTVYKTANEAFLHFMFKSFNKIAFVATGGLLGSIPYPKQRFEFTGGSQMIVSTATLPVEYNAKGIHDFCKYVVNGCAPGDTFCNSLVSSDVS